MNFLNLLADAPKQGNMMQTVIMVVVMLGFFYLILIRPEQKRRKKMESLRGALKAGDKVTAMGIVGTVDRVEDKTVILTMFDGAKLEFLKQSITEVTPDANEVKAD
ncbi:MAG: preprotein translocase subunit YajC [Simkaniaceae bacterium]|nr:preprotein translocase subunit YajC [Simkaniaceae bacterium]